jgi:hypothetical protein
MPLWYMCQPPWPGGDFCGARSRCPNRGRQGRPPQRTAAVFMRAGAVLKPAGVMSAAVPSGLARTITLRPCSWGRPSRVHTAVMVHAAPVVLSGLLPISLQGRPVSLLLAWPRVPTRCHGRPQTVACHGDPGLPSSRTRMTELSPMMMPTFMIGASRFRARRHPVQDLPTVRPRR